MKIVKDDLFDEVAQLEFNAERIEEIEDAIKEGDGISPSGNEGYCLEDLITIGHTALLMAERRVSSLLQIQHIEEETTDKSATNPIEAAIRWTGFASSGDVTDPTCCPAGHATFRLGHDPSVGMCVESTIDDFPMSW